MYAVQGYSIQIGAYKTLFAPYYTEASANMMRNSLSERNPQISYRTISLTQPLDI